MVDFFALCVWKSAPVAAVAFMPAWQQIFLLAGKRQEYQPGKLADAAMQA